MNRVVKSIKPEKNHVDLEFLGGWVEILTAIQY